MTAKTMEAAPCGGSFVGGGDAYQVLGLPPLETNVAKIHDAAQRKQRQLEAKRRDTDPNEWQAARQTLHEAEATLLNATDKAILDAALRRRAFVRALRVSGPLDTEAIFVHQPVVMAAE